MKSWYCNSTCLMSDIVMASLPKSTSTVISGDVLLPKPGKWLLCATVQSMVGRKDTEDDAGFTLYIWARLQQDEIGKACQEDEIILAVGKHLYDGKKPVAKLIKSKAKGH